MPKREIEILRTVTITREESVIIVVDVPKRVLKDEEVFEWADVELKKEGTALRTLADAADWDLNDEDESEEIDEINDLGPAD